jgi:uncharacterized Zn finger protein
VSEVLITEQANIESRYSYDEWLAKYYREQGDPKTALKFAEASFIQRPGLINYQQIQQLAESIDSWPKVRSRLLKQLTATKQWQLLAEIAIHESDLDQAIKLLKHLSRPQQISLKWEIAQVAPPKIAIPIYEELVHAAIERRNRSAYQEAVRYLQSIQKLKKAPKTAQEWQQYIQRIRDRYPTLRALQDELDRM